MERYRLRTWLRGELPWSLAERIPKGFDCGHHEWYLMEDGRWGCYHCVQETTESPWPGTDWARMRLRAIYADMALLMASGLSGPDLYEETQRYDDEVAELRALLEDEPPTGQEEIVGVYSGHRPPVPAL